MSEQRTDGAGRTVSINLSVAGGVARFYVDGVRTETGSALCPDLLAYEDIGAADNWRGRVVRAFFWFMRWWPA